ncbi:MAG TPA: chemotaxis protein CheW [Anaerolineae bacterium]
MAIIDGSAEDHLTEFVTVTIGNYLFGLPISRVQDVFVPDRVTRVPLAPPDVAGILNLRGRVMTVIEMRSRLDLGTRQPSQPVMVIGIELKGESYGLLVDSVGEVMQLQSSAREANPANLDPRLGRVSAGIYRLEGQLMVVLDVDRVLDIKNVVMVA